VSTFLNVQPADCWIFVLDSLIQPIYLWNCGPIHGLDPDVWTRLVTMMPDWLSYKAFHGTPLMWTVFRPLNESETSVIEIVMPVVGKCSDGKRSGVLSVSLTSEVI